MHDDDQEDGDRGARAARRTDFDCIECNANNPIDDGFTAGDEVTCHYCGSSFAVVIVNDKLKFKAT